MYNNIYRFFVLLIILLFSMVSLSTAEMSSDGFSIPSSVMDSTGKSKDSDNFELLDSVGQSTPIGVSTSTGFQLEAGFLYGTMFTMTLKVTIPNVIEGLEEILKDPSLTKQEKKNINLAIEPFLEDALDSYTLYETGDFGALAKALNKTKNAIKKLIFVTSVDTAIYQKMLGKAAELGVTTEINVIASVAGDDDPNVIQARIFLNEGSTELLDGLYFEAVKSFVKAYKEALLAIT